MDRNRLAHKRHNANRLIMKKMYRYLIMFTNTYFIQETLDMFYLIISYLPISERMKDRYTKNLNINKN